MHKPKFQSLLDKDPEFKELFEARAVNGKLKLEQALDVLNDWSIPIGLDCE